MTLELSSKPRLSLALKALAVFGLIFGIVTLFSGGNVLFGPKSAQAAAGNYFPFVVWFNFLAGFVYIITAACILRRNIMALPLSMLIATCTAITAIAFAQFVSQGVNFEMRTVGALAIRTGFWSVVAYVLYRSKPQ